MSWHSRYSQKKSVSVISLQFCKKKKVGHNSILLLTGEAPRTKKDWWIIRLWLCVGSSLWHSESQPCHHGRSHAPCDGQCHQPCQDNVAEYVPVHIFSGSEAPHKDDAAHLAVCGADGDAHIAGHQHCERRPDLYAEPTATIQQSTPLHTYIQEGQVSYFW